MPKAKIKTPPKKPLTQHEMAVMGGEARARKMTKKQRSASARHAALERWSNDDSEAASG